MRDASRIAARGALLSPYLVLLGAVFASPDVDAALYTCRDAGGGLEFRDRPCEDGARSLDATGSPEPAGPAGPAPRLGEASPDASPDASDEDLAEGPAADVAPLPDEEL